MTDKLKKIIVKIIDKKKGIKVADLHKYLEVKASEIEGLGEITFTTVKDAVIALFSENKIDIVEYKVPGEGEKNRIFAIPRDSVVTCTTSEPDLPEPTVEVKTMLPANLFGGFVVIGDDSAEYLEDAAEAQASYMVKAGDHKNPRLYGAVPISLRVEALLDTVNSEPEIEVAVITTVAQGKTANSAEVGSAIPDASGTVGAAGTVGV